MKLTDLTAQFEQERDETLQKAKEIESVELSKFEADLKQRFDSAASTLSSALEGSKTSLQKEVENYHTALKNAMTNDSTVLQQHIDDLASEVQQWTPRMLKVIKGAILAPVITIVLCFMTVVSTLAWWRFENRH